MQYAEMKEKIESSFQPYHCGVERQSVNGDEGLGIRVSNEDDTLLYEPGGATLKALRTNLYSEIEMWREGARKTGFDLDD